MSAKDAILKRENAKKPKPVVRKAKQPVEAGVEPTEPVETPVSEVVE